MEVADLTKWQGEGQSLKQIRGFIEEKYSRYGKPTDTAPFLLPEASPAPSWATPVLPTPAARPTPAPTAPARAGRFTGGPRRAPDMLLRGGGV
jgi:hypothetical protein